MNRPRGLTPIEVLVVVILLAILLCLAIVGLLQLRVRARCERCARNLAGLGEGLETYTRLHAGSFPRGTVPHEALPPEKRLSWYVGAWKELAADEGELSIDLEQSWNAEVNRRPTATRDGEQYSTVNRPKLRCPADYGRATACEPGPTTYVGIAGVGADAASLPQDDPREGIFGYNRQTAVERIVDGRKETLLVGETALKPGPWTAGGPATVRGLDSEHTPYLGPSRQFGGLHPGGSNMLFADGGVKFLNEAFDSIALASMAQISDATRAENRRAGEPQPR